MADTMSHYARLAGLTIVLWLDGQACTGADARFETIRKVLANGDAFAWFAPSNKAKPTAKRQYRGFKVPFEKLPNGLATTVEVSVGLDGERVKIPLSVVPGPALDKQGKVVHPKARGEVAIKLGDDEMVASCTLSKWTQKPDGSPREHPFITVTPAVHRPNSGERAEVAVDSDVFGAS